MRYGEYKFEKTCHTMGVILSNDKGDSFSSIENHTLDEYSFVNDRTKEVINIKLIVAEEEKG